MDGENRVYRGASPIQKIGLNNQVYQEYTVERERLKQKALEDKNRLRLLPADTKFNLDLDWSSDLHGMLDKGWSMQG